MASPIAIIKVLILCFLPWGHGLFRGRTQRLRMNGNADEMEALNKRVPTTPDRRWEILAIGKVECSYIHKFDVPRQATILPKIKTANGTELGLKPYEIGKLVIFPEYKDCLANLDGFDYLWILALFHTNTGYKTKIRPQPVADAELKPPQEVGLFSSRAPHRPNPIALSALKIVKVDYEEGAIYVEGLDLLHDTPILDIKPYIPAFDSFPDARAGWMDLIRSDYLEARKYGYQNIRSKRGIRNRKSAEKKRLLASSSAATNNDDESDNEDEKVTPLISN